MPCKADPAKHGPVLIMREDFCEVVLRPPDLLRRIPRFEARPKAEAGQAQGMAPCDTHAKATRGRNCQTGATCAPTHVDLEVPDGQCQGRTRSK